MSKLHSTILSALGIVEEFANARTSGVVLVTVLVELLLTKIETRRLKFSGLLCRRIASGSIFMVLRGGALQATGRIAFAFF